MSEVLVNNIKKYRRKKGWSQQRLAEETKLSIGQIRALEVGRIKEPGKTVLIKLADAFGISIDDLVGRKTKKPKK